MKRKNMIALILIVLVLIMVIDFQINEEGVLEDFFSQFATESMLELRGSAGMFPHDEEPLAVRKANFSYTAQDIEVFYLQNEVGSIDIKGHNGDKIIVEYEINIYAEDEAEAEQYLNQVVIDYAVTKREFELFTDRPESLPDSVRGVEILFDIAVPRDIFLDLSNKYGDVNVRDFQSGLILESRYTTTKVASVRGDISINNDYGTLNLSDLEGKVFVESSYNKNVMQNIEGSLILKTNFTQNYLKDISANTELIGRYGQGDIENLTGELNLDIQYMGLNLDEIDAKIKGSMEYGDVNIESLNNDLEVSSRYSDLKIWMKKNLRDLNVDVTARHGSLKSDLDLNTIKENNTYKVSGIIGQGSVDLIIDAYQADLELIYEN